MIALTLRTVLGVTCHRSGRVTYWCPVRKSWIENAETITPEALAALPEEEQARVRKHLWRNGVFV